LTIISMVRASVGSLNQAGFTPNSDGINDILRPIAVGVERINYFRVFNRWGEMVFSTTIPGKGWDGKLNGIPQAAGIFIYYLEMEGLSGHKLEQKGTVLLSR